MLGRQFVQNLTQDADFGLRLVGFDEDELAVGEASAGLVDEDAVPESLEVG